MRTLATNDTTLSGNGVSEQTKDFKLVLLDVIE